MDFDSYVNATTMEVKEQIKTLKLSSQKVYDPDKNRFGRIERYDPVEHEVCDVELLGSDIILVDVPLMELVPHHAFRFRAGQRILLDGYVGLISEIKRNVKIIRGNGSKLRFHMKEESSGTYDSYMSNGKLPTWWDRINPDNPDVYSTIEEEIGYPGSPVVVTPGMALSNESGNFLWALKDRLKRLKDLIFRSDSRRYQVVENLDIVKKVKITKVKVVWESRIRNIISSEVPTANKYIVKFADVLAPLSQELCEEGSHRMYMLKEGMSVKSKAVWLNEKIMTDGAPRSITVDEVDNLTVNSVWLEHNKYSIGDVLPVKVVIRKRVVEVRWEDDSLEVLPVSQVVKMVGTDNGDGSLYEINIETDNESVEKGPADGIRLSRNETVEEYNIPWLRNVPRFQKYDFVVDVLRKFPSTTTVYGVIKAINPKEFTVVVDWYNVNEQYNTSLLEDQAVVSIFDLEHMDDLNDPRFRIDWKQKKTQYGSEIVCCRFGKTDKGFVAGYVREINQYGQIVVNADSSSWTLWPCEVKRLNFVAYQKDNGSWAEFVNAFRTDEEAMKDSLSDYRWQQYKQSSLPRFDLALSNGCERLSEYPRLRKLKYAPSNHWYLGYKPDSVSVSLSGSVDELTDSAVMSALINQELKKTLIQIEGIDVYFCTFEDQPKLASALVVGKKGTIYEDGLFMFDIYFPQEFPNDFPLLHYVCYATNLNPILEDAYTCGPIKPLKFLNMTLEEMSVSLGKQTASTLELSSSSNSFLNENAAKEESSGDHKRTDGMYNLTDFIWYIQETLFRVSPEDVMGELLIESLLKDQVFIYHEFLLGKKLEALANLLLCPYAPWLKFLQLYRERIQRLLETSERILKDRPKSTMQHDGSGDASLEDYSKGSVLFLQRRIEFLRKALHAHADAILEAQQWSGSSDVSYPAVHSVSSDVVETTSMGRSSSYSCSSSCCKSVDGMVLPEVGACGHDHDDSNPDEAEPQDCNSSLVTAFEEKFADLNLDETIASCEDQKPEERAGVQTEV